MSTRSKPEIQWVRDLDHANQILGEIAGIKRSIKDAEIALNAEIDAAKTRTEALVGPLKKRLAEMESGVAFFATHNKDALFRGKRSLELLFGVLGFRRSTELKPKKSWANVLEKLNQLAFKNAIRVKQEPDKEVLSQWSDEALVLVDVARVEKDLFYYETKQEEVA
ncbi:hypothetical protein SIID45300_01052 [Candidatus Magnetaquicoccaceae bacterium FCR-1]|uniref:Host-nuclease inhibitor protein Gam n=1 Tax=Candidatus Magnetaquiglobus chichijimensis TaxID=3141448 RepID=A0ABQ0C778_9PROT